MNKHKIVQGFSLLLTLLFSLMILTLTGCGGASAGSDDTQDQTETGDGESGDSTEPDSDLPQTYSIVDTGQTTCYNQASETDSLDANDVFFGQDASYSSLQPGYSSSSYGTVTDLNTGLMWQQNPGEKKSYDEAMAELETFELGGYDDWRLPTIKELYSLIQFSGVDPSGLVGQDISTLVPFIDTDYFIFQYGDETIGERIIDSQYMSSTKYVSTTMNGDETMFGVNFADGRIKGYPLTMQGSDKLFYVMYVRGNTDYGINSFVNNDDGTIYDQATDLMWMQDDSGHLNAGEEGDGALSWEVALEWAENLEYGGYSDWRLPNAKELQSIVDYSRSLKTTDSAAIDPIFHTTSILDEGGETNYPFYWTGTTHANQGNGAYAAYIAFGEALGWMQNPFGDYVLMDVHGAGSQRSDPKIGDPADYPHGFGPQGDVRRIYNFVRCVRGGL